MKLCTLNKLIRKRDWIAVDKRLQTLIGKREAKKSDRVMYKCCKYRAPLDIIEKVYNLNPDSIHMTRSSKVGKLPIHVVCEVYSFAGNGSSECEDALAIVDLLLRKNPSSLVKPDKVRGWNPLHYVCSRGIDAVPELIDLLMSCSCSGSSVRSVDKLGMTCLHVACLYGVPVESISILVDSFPDALSTPSRVDGYLPIHCVCLSGAPISHIKYLSRQKGFADSLSHIDKSGRNALHYACEWILSICALNLLINNNFKIIEMADKLGKTPLHIAVQKQTSSEVVNQLGFYNPSALSKKDNIGKTPYDYARKSSLRLLSSDAKRY